MKEKLLEVNFWQLFLFKKLSKFSQENIPLHFFANFVFPIAIGIVLFAVKKNI